MFFLPHQEAYLGYYGVKGTKRDSNYTETFNKHLNDFLRKNGL